MKSRILWVAVSAVTLGLVVAGPAGSSPLKPAAPTRVPSQVINEVAHDTSPPLRDITPIGPTPKNRPDTTSKPSIPGSRVAAMIASTTGRPTVAATPDLTPPASMPSTSANFAGMDNPNGYYPPDLTGDVSLNHYVQMVNVAFNVYDKAGTSLYGPADFNTLFFGFGGPCQFLNDGDPIVMYDGLADRWVMSQFALPDTGDNLECIAVSATSDPLGAYHRYAFNYGSLMPDYPKLGVWPDGYYATYNMFDAANGFAYAGAQECVLERSKMLVGEAATQQCFTQAEEYSVLPSDIDGPTPPPVGSPNYMVAEHWADTNKLTMYRFHTDWTTPANSTLEGPIYIPVKDFTWACVFVNRGQCIQQPDNTTVTPAVASPKLEALGGRAMYRLAYRNLGDHESLVVSHTVAMDGNLELTAQTGISWYEIQAPNAPAPVVAQDGTNANPDGTTYQWMASLAMDKQGNIGMGYSSSKSTLFPSINYTGRLATDPPGVMAQGEGTIQTGGGSQLGLAARWGDYTTMQVDPEDDCTFWYVNEYLKTTGRVNWSTRIASFKFPGCTGSTTTPDAPATASGTRGNASAAVSWTEPASNGGLPVTGYTVTSTPEGKTCTTLVGVDSDPLTCTVTGLTNGTPYTFAVNATNAKGNGPTVATSAVTPADVPGAPTLVTGTAGNSQAVISWAAPLIDGGSPITGYTVTSNPGGKTCTAAATPRRCTVTGLTNGTAYTFTVVATNAAGTSAPSEASDPITPVAPTPTPEPTPGPSSPSTPTTPKPTPTPEPTPGPVAPGPLKLSVGSNVVFAPGAPIRAAVSDGQAGCTVRVTVRGSSRSARVSNLGTVTVIVRAPKPNTRYVVSAVQSGVNCASQSASTVIRVKGPYVAGAAVAKANSTVRFTAGGFKPGSAIAWSVTKGGKAVTSADRTTSAKGLSSGSFTLGSAGRYVVKAKQGKTTAQMTVVVR